MRTRLYIWQEILDSAPGTIIVAATNIRAAHNRAVQEAAKYELKRPLPLEADEVRDVEGFVLSITE